jgi:cyclopropane-fatty-acyl-phospholipid synthase
MTTDADSRIIAARRITAHVAELLQADLSLRLWNGEVLPLGPNARDDIQIVIARPSAVRRLILKPGLMTLFEMFATGDMRIEGGSPLEAADRWDHGRAVHLAKRADKLLIAKSGRALPAGRLRRGRDPAARVGQDRQRRHRRRQGRPQRPGLHPVPL